MTAQRDSTSRRTATRAGWIALLAVGLAPACASDMVRYDQAGRTSLWNKQRGYSVELPQLDAAEGWREFRLDDADLAFRNRDGSTLSLQSSCRDRKAAPALLARHLAIGVPAAGRQGAPVELRGDPGWRQSFEASEQGVTVRVHTLSLVGGGCVFDWTALVGAVVVLCIGFGLACAAVMFGVAAAATPRWTSFGCWPGRCPSSSSPPA